VSGDLLTKIALSLYYLSWVAGLINDVDEQEEAYAKAPNQGQFPWKGGLLATGAITGVFAILCIVTSAKLFSLVLALFLIINIAGYIYIIIIVSPTIERSRNEYIAQRDHQSLIKLEIIEGYMIGPWQWYRFAYGLAAVGVVMAAGFSRLPQLLNSVYPPIPPESYVALSVLFYVITVEGWIWAMRIRTKVAKSTVDVVIERVSKLNARSGGAIEVPLTK
jgi:hypothetical protein